MLHIGCHLSASRGFAAMGRQALELEADTFQFFTRNPRGSRAKDLDPADAAALRELLTAHRFAPLIAHAPYTLNLCGAEEKNRRFAQETMADDLSRLEHLPGQYYNFHPGSHVGQGIDAGIALIADGLNAILRPDQSTTVLLETMAGKGTEIGRTFEELAQIYDGVMKKDRLRVCFDTCHTHDAGYDIINNFDSVIDTFDHILGKDQIAVFHINDSKNPCGAHKDRHENLGKGYIGFDALSYIVHHPDFSDVPKILETPWIPIDGDKKNTRAPYKEEIALLRGDS